MRRSTAIFLTGTLVLLARRAPAIDFTFPWVDKEASFEITETLVLDYHDDNFDLDDTNDRYGDIRNRLNLKLAIDDFTFSARFDTGVFVEAPGTARPPYLTRHEVPAEKLTATYRGERLFVDLGDFYASVGRGLALQVRKVDELSEDTTLLGAKVRWTLDSIELTALSGLSNPTNIDGVTEKSIDNSWDLLSGLQVAWRPLDWFVWGVHGVHLWIDPFASNEIAQGQIQMSALPEHSVVAGTSVKFPDLFERADAYAEFDWMQKDFKLPDIPASDGWALYLGGNLYLGNWTVTAEFKSYSDFELFTQSDTGPTNNYLNTRIDYILPPTLEPVDMEVLNNADITGGRLRVDWRPGGADTLLFCSYAGFRGQDQCDGCERWIYNAQLGIEQDFLGRGRAHVDVGLREEVPDYAGGIHHHLVYLNADIKLPLGARHSLSARATNWWLHEFEKPRFAPEPNTSDTLKGEVTLGYSWSPLLSLGVIFGYDTEKSGTRDLDVFFVTASGATRQLFLAGTATLNLSSRVVIKLLGGQLRGGPKCVSGACRYFPPFSGVRLTTVVRL